MIHFNTCSGRRYRGFYQVGDRSYLKYFFGTEHFYFGTSSGFFVTKAELLLTVG